MMTVKEVAAALRVSTATVYALVNGGQLEHFRVLNAIRIPCDAVGALMKRKP
jgi:excisionase family DNA binding protein